MKNIKGRRVMRSYEEHGSEEQIDKVGGVA